MARGSTVSFADLPKAKKCENRLHGISRLAVNQRQLCSSTLENSHSLVLCGGYKIVCLTRSQQLRRSEGDGASANQDARGGVLQECNVASTQAHRRPLLRRRRIA